MVFLLLELEIRNMSNEKRVKKNMFFQGNVVMHSDIFRCIYVK